MSGSGSDLAGQRVTGLRGLSVETHPTPSRPPPSPRTFTAATTKTELWRIYVLYVYVRQAVQQSKARQVSLALGLTAWSYTNYLLGWCSDLWSVSRWGQSVQSWASQAQAHGEGAEKEKEKENAVGVAEHADEQGLGWRSIHTEPSSTPVM